MPNTGHSDTLSLQSNSMNMACRQTQDVREDTQGPDDTCFNS